MRNIILVSIDSLRADHCGFMGYERDTTPNLDRLAADGVSVTNAISPASRTNPSMSAIFTGENLVYENHVSNPEISKRHLRRHGTLAEQLSEMGYTTGAFNPNAFASRYYGFDRGFDYYEDFLFTEQTYQSIFDKFLSDSGIFGTLRNLRNFIRREEVFRTWDSYIDDAVAWASDQEEPFFLWTFALETHFPYLTPRRYRQWGNLFKMYYYNWKCNSVLDDADPELSSSDVSNIIDIYDDSIRFVDAFVGELERRLAEFDPIIIVHADHGEAMGEHEIYGHFYPSLYEENTHVPFIIADGENQAEINQPVSLRDIPAIIQSLAVDRFQPSKLGDYAVTAAEYDARRDRDLVAARTEKWKLLSETSTGKKSTYKCYDLDSDPSEQANLYDHSAPVPIIDTLRHLCRTERATKVERKHIQDCVSDIASEL